MKEQISKQKLSYIHNILDRELQNVNDNFMFSSNYSQKNKDDNKNINKDENNSFQNLKNYRTGSQNQFDQLQKKLIYLQKKMQNINLSDNNSSYSIISENQFLGVKAPIYNVQSKNNIHQSKQSKGKSINKNPDDQNIRKSKNEQLKKLGSKKKINKKDTEENQANYVKIKRQLLTIPISPKNSAKKNIPFSNKSISKADIDFTKIQNDIREVERSFEGQKKSISHRSINNSGKKKMNVSENKRNQRQVQRNIKIEYLERQVNKYKVENKKLNSRIKALEMMQIQYKKLKQNFEKSEHIRKQQKILIQNLKKKKIND